jgi:acetyltransferase
MTPDADPHDEVAVLPDGTMVPIRSIRSEDEAAHRRFHSRLSLDSRYGRFLHAVGNLSAAETARFVNVDGERRVAIVAVDPHDSSELIAIARYDRSDDPLHAEVAIVVDERWQGHGLGTAVLRRLVQHATSHGVQMLRANILASNVRSLALFHELGLPEHARMVDGVIELDLKLSPDQPPSSMGV